MLPITQYPEHGNKTDNLASDYFFEKGEGKKVVYREQEYSKETDGWGQQPCTWHENGQLHDSVLKEVVIWDISKTWMTHRWS